MHAHAPLSYLQWLRSLSHGLTQTPVICGRTGKCLAASFHFQDTARMDALELHTQQVRVHLEVRRAVCHDTCLTCSTVWHGPPALGCIEFTEASSTAGSAGARADWAARSWRIASAQPGHH